MHDVSRRLSAFATVALVISVWLCGQVAWVKKYDEALKLAQSRSQFVIVDVFTTWCPPCREMDRTVFQDPRFVEFSQGQVFMHLDAENDSEGRKIAGRFDVIAYPTILVLNAQGEEISRLVGGRTTDGLIEDLNQIFADPRPLKEIEKQALTDQNDYRVQYAAGSRFLERKQNKKAIAFLRRALELADDQQRRIDCLSSLFRVTRDERQFDQSLKALEDLEKLAPEMRKSYEWQQSKAQALIALGRNDEAFQILDQLIRTTSGPDKQMARELLKDLPKKYQKADKELTKTLSKAAEYLRAGKPELALPLALQAAEAAPHSAEAHMAVAGAYFRSSEKQTDPAKKAECLTSGLDHMRLSRRLDPDSLTLYQAAKAALAARYMPLTPTTPEAVKLFSSAEKAFAEERYKDAAQLYQRTIDVEPGFGRAYLNMGDCYFQSSLYDQALRWYLTASSKTPLDPAPYRFAADAHLKGGRVAEARDSLVRAIFADPEYPLAWRDIEPFLAKDGKQLERHGGVVPTRLLLVGMDSQAYDEAMFSAVPLQTVEAWREYVKYKLLWRQEKFRATFPKESFYHSTPEEEVDCLRKLTERWTAMKEQDSGLSDPNLDFLRQVVVDNLLEAFVYFELFTEEYRPGFEVWKKSNQTAAREYVERYLFGSPVATKSAGEYNSSAYEAYNRGVALHRSGKEEEAIVEYEKALAQEPNMVEALHNISILYLATDRNEEARKSLLKWKGLRPQEAGPLAMLARLAAEDERYGEAIAYLEKAVQLESDASQKAQYQKSLEQLRQFKAQ